MKANPVIRDFMVSTPLLLEKGSPIGQARDIMRAHHFRHLPVVESGELVGIISERNLSATLRLHPTSCTVPICDIMTLEPFAVHEDTPFDSVLLEMTRQKYGCAVITDKGNRPIGIFTTVDACHALREILKPVSPECI